MARLIWDQHDAKLISTKNTSVAWQCELARNCSHCVVNACTGERLMTIETFQCLAKVSWKLHASRIAVYFIFAEIGIKRWFWRRKNEYNSMQWPTVYYRLMNLDFVYCCPSVSNRWLCHSIIRPQRRKGLFQKLLAKKSAVRFFFLFLFF